MKKLINIIVILLVIGGTAYYYAHRGDVPASSLSEAQAREIAQNSCIKGGEALGKGEYNATTKTWWYDANLNATRPGCMPACVVSEETKTAEVNWRCTGVIQP